MVGIARSSPNSPSPIVYAPTQEFIGSDGKWSSFVLHVGSPLQNFQVLPASTSGEVYVPIAEGCRKGNATDCGALRGAYEFSGRRSDGFVVNSSSTWHEIGIFEMDVRPELDFTANGLYGLDSVGLGLQDSDGPMLENQVVAGVANPAVYVGMVGLGPKPANFSGFDNPQRSLIQTLKDEGKIPSLSYGYSAGAYYSKSRHEQSIAAATDREVETPKALGSLTLGGYDQSRFEPNDITFPFDPDDSRYLSLNVQSIVAQNLFNLSENLLEPLDQPVYVQIDYTVPHIWLPTRTCDIIADKFKLYYDNVTDLYLVNDTIHDELKQRNPSVTIGLGATADPGSRVNIVLPYTAFDLQTTQPIYPNATSYFPIRRAYNESMYTSGRTFMQEAYIKVDYERGNFSVHQALSPSTSEKQQIHAITSPGDETVSGVATSRYHLLGKGAIAGIVIGIIVLVSLSVSLLFWFFLKKRNRTKKESKTDVDQRSEELPNGCIYEKDGPGFFEAGGTNFSELHPEGLQVALQPNPRSELTGCEATYELSDSRSVSIKEMGSGRSSPSSRSSK